MPQIFQVLRCYQCLAFQVHQTKKVKKWECKLCGEKQSHKKYYALGNGKECRLHVQKLNKLSGDMQEQSYSTDGSDEEHENVVEQKKDNLNTVPLKQGSKWDDYIDESKFNLDNIAEKDDSIVLNNTKVVLEIPPKRKKLLIGSQHQNKIISKCLPHTKNVISRNKSENNIDSCPVINTENDEVHYQQEQKLNTKKSYVKFVPPIINIHSKWATYNEESISKKNKDILKINSTSINNCTLNSMEQHNSLKQTKAEHISELITLKASNYNIGLNSKWNKSTEKYNNINNKKEPIHNNNAEYIPKAVNLPFEISNTSSKCCLDKNVNSQNVTDCMKEESVTSIFDDGDLEVLDIY